MIPTIPDIFSTYGIPQIITRVREFSAEVAEPIEPLGIVTTKFWENSTVYHSVLKNLQGSKDAPVLETIIKQANDSVAPAELQSYSRTLKQKYGYSGLMDSYLALAQEILSKLEG